MLRRTSLMAAIAALVAAAVPAQAASPTYVALGDSYSSGVGTRSYINDGTSCSRSVYAYPALIATARGYALNFRACSGAKVADVTNTQLSALTSTTNYVTLSVGGNDAGFADVLTECAQPAWMSDCNGAIDRAQSIVNNTLPGTLKTLYFLGAEVNAMYPLGPIFHGSGLNITVMSLNGKLDVGLISTPELLPDLWDLADDFVAGMKELLAAAR